MALSAGTAFVDIQPNIGSGFQGALASKLGPIGKTAGVALGVGVAAGVGGAVALANIGQTFDEAFDTIRVGTGATGETLEGLKGDFKAVLASVPTDAATAGAAIADLNTRTGATGETLQGLASQVIELGRITGEDAGTLIETSTRLFGDWGVALEDSGAALDTLFRASQTTGPPVSELQRLLVQYGAPLRQFGFGMEESAALLGKFEKEGVNTELVMGSLRIALGKFAREGADPAEALDETIAAIQNAGSAGEANALALETFGARAGADMAAAIREGKFEIDDLVDTIAGSGETIADAAGDTESFGEKWTELKNQVFVAIEPLATKFIEALGGLFDVIGPAIGPVVEAIGGALGALGGLFSGVSSDAEGASSKITPILEAIGAAFGFLRDVVSTVFGAISGAFKDNADTIGGIGEGIGAVFSRIGEIARTVFGALATFWEQWGDTITGILGAAIGAVLDVIRGAFDIIKGIFDVVLGILTGDWSRAWDGIKSILSGALGIVTGLIRNVFGAIVSIASGIVSNFGAAISSGLDNVVGFFRELPGRIFAFLSSLPGRFLSLGADLVAGLVRGLGNIAGALTDKLKSGISSALGKVKSFFGVGSPSRVFATELGLPLAQGVAVGTEATGRLAGDALVDGIEAAAARARSRAATELAGIAQPPAAIAANRAAFDAARLGPAAAGAGTTITLEAGAVQVINPAPEPASTTVPRELRRLAVTLGK